MIDCPTIVDPARHLDDQAGAPYYTAFIGIDEKDLAELPQVKLYPGMPATALIRTVVRTAIDHLVSPLAISFNKAYRQR